MKPAMGTPRNALLGRFRHGCCKGFHLSCLRYPCSRGQERFFWRGSTMRWILMGEMDLPLTYSNQKVNHVARLS